MSTRFIDDVFNLSRFYDDVFNFVENWKEETMSNKFVSFLEAAGRDFLRGLAWFLPYAAGPGSIAVSLFAPALGPIFNSTVSAVVLAEQKYAALGKQTGTGASKLADVLQLMEPVIAQGLVVAGKPADTEAVKGYINSVVTVLNTMPALIVAPAVAQ